jgi:hypothetical protein
LIMDLFRAHRADVRSSVADIDGDRLACHRLPRTV